jgi:hypothetical protein
MQKRCETDIFVHSSTIYDKNVLYNENEHNYKSTRNNCAFFYIILIRGMRRKKENKYGNWNKNRL